MLPLQWIRTTTNKDSPMNQPTLFPETMMPRILLPPMVLTLNQPWASGVVRGFKLWETRSKPQPYRGPLFIHSSLSVKPADRWLFSNYLGNYDCLTSRKKYPLPLGKIIGMVIMEDCKPIEGIRDRLQAEHDFQELAFGDYSDGRYAYQFSCPIAFENPVPYAGYQCIWDPVRARKEKTDILRLQLELQHCKTHESIESGKKYQAAAENLNLIYEELRSGSQRYPQYPSRLKPK